MGNLMQRFKTVLSFTAVMHVCYDCSHKEMLLSISQRRVKAAVYSQLIL